MPYKENDEGDNEDKQCKHVNIISTEALPNEVTIPGTESTGDEIVDERETTDDSDANTTDQE